MIGRVLFLSVSVVFLMLHLSVSTVLLVVDLGLRMILLPVDLRVSMIFLTIDLSLGVIFLPVHHHVLVGDLGLGPLEVPFMHGGLLRWRGPGVHSAGAVEGVAGAVVVDNNRAVHVRVANDGPVHVEDGGVIAEVAARPNASGEAVSEVSMAIIDSPVKAYVRAPEAGMP